MMLHSASGDGADAGPSADCRSRQPVNSRQPDAGGSELADQFPVLGVGRPAADGAGDLGADSVDGGDLLLGQRRPSAPLLA